MASKRLFTASMPCIAQLSAPARRSFLPRKQHLAVSLPSASVRLFTIPRPRNPSPFTPSPTEPTSSPPEPSPTTPTTPASTAPQTTNQPIPKTQQPHYELTFTCRPCDTRSRHRVSKHGYHHGSVLISCPGCKNRHVISDHLRIFGDTARTVEDILRDKGELVKRGMVGTEGEEDLEFWDDGTTTPREAWEPVENKGNGVADDAPPGSSFKSVRPGEKKE